METDPSCCKAFGCRVHSSIREQLTAFTERIPRAALDRDLNPVRALRTASSLSIFFSRKRSLRAERERDQWPDCGNAVQTLGRTPRRPSDPAALLSTAGTVCLDVPEFMGGMPHQGTKVVMGCLGMNHWCWSRSEDQGLPRRFSCASEMVYIVIRRKSRRIAVEFSGDLRCTNGSGTGTEAGSLVGQWCPHS